MRCFNIAIYRGYMTGWGLVEGTEGEGFDGFAGRIVGSKCWIPERIIKVSYERGQRVVFGHCTHFNASNLPWSQSQSQTRTVTSSAVCLRISMT